MITKAMIERQAAESVSPGYDWTDEDMVGIMVARYFEWDGYAILRAAYHALEDANFHTECAALAERHPEAFAVKGGA